MDPLRIGRDRPIVESWGDFRRRLPLDAMRFLEAGSPWASGGAPPQFRRAGPENMLTEVAPNGGPVMTEGGFRGSAHRAGVHSPAQGHGDLSMFDPLPATPQGPAELSAELSEVELDRLLVIRPRTTRLDLFEDG